MKLKRSQVEYISYQIIKHMVRDGVIEVDDQTAVSDGFQRAFTEDLMVEDRLNDEVRELLEEHADKISGGSVEYHEMFKLVKAKLVRERKLIL
jgi:hypothetical protein